MASSRLNVLVYAGPGCTIESVRHCVFTLRRLLSPRYAVLTVTSDALINEPWPQTCALLVLPGGADVGYCRALNGAGNRRIQRFLEVQGGAYLGFCAGGYYGTARCEFEVDDPRLAVIGSRELAFFPGTSRGCAYGGFKYHSEDGARAVELVVEKAALPGAVPAVFRSYYNGGGVFVDAPKFAEQGVEVLASYTDKLHVDPGEGMAAVVYCKVGDGGAILTGPHPEFASVNLHADANVPAFSKIIDDLHAEDDHRTNFLKACLSKLGLNVNQEQNAVPSLSRMHLSCSTPDVVSEIIATLQDIVVPENGGEYIKDENDTFRLEKSSAWPTAGFRDSLNEAPALGDKEPNGESADAEDRIVDYSKLTKRIVIHEKDLPPAKETPYFNHHAYFANLGHYQSKNASSIDPLFGRLLMYAEVITSTNTILEKNTQLLRRLPSGFLATATVQVAGRGRGNNVWVSPAGSLMFSLVVRHPVSLMPKAPVVFLQYLAAIAIVEGVHAYDKGYGNLPVKLKWPNDIYALDPSRPPAEKAYVKIGGILVNSHYSSSEYLSVIGIGLNATNALPTTSLSALLPPSLLAFTPEKLLARLVTTFSMLYRQFCESGFDERLERTYYRHWLHSGQVVTLETEGGMRARIKGITKDWGLLVAEELEDGIDGERKTGRTVELQSDSNSFDFFKGLVKRKT